MPPKRVNPLQFLKSTRTVIVAGKGGVGKTTVTAVWARAAFRAGLRVLAVELDGKLTLAGLLPDQEVVSLSAQAALAEYLDTHGLARVARRLASSGVIDVVANAAPGIDDIVVLGKLKQLERGGDYDVVVVDGPAAGHAVTMLMAPASLSAAARSGPVRAQADEVLAMLADPARCQVSVVTVPEATPVNEAAQIAATLVDRVQVTLGPVVLNAVDVGDHLQVGRADSGMNRAAAFTNARRTMHAAEAARLGELLDLPQVVLPLMDGSGLDAAAIDALAEALVAG